MTNINITQQLTNDGGGDGDASVVRRQPMGKERGTAASTAEGQALTPPSSTRDDDDGGCDR